MQWQFSQCITQQVFDPKIYFIWRHESKKTTTRPPCCCLSSTCWRMPCFLEVFIFAKLPKNLLPKSFVLFRLPMSPRDWASASYRCSQAVGNSMTEPVIVRLALSGSRDLADGNAAQVRSLSCLIPWGLPVSVGVIVRSSPFVRFLPMTYLVP